MPSGRHKSNKTTMQDIADKLNISKVSVSKALGGKPGIGDDLRRSILQTALQMGYEHVPQGTVKRFAFVVSKHFFLETDAFYSEMYYRFDQQCLEQHCSATLIIVSGTDLKELRLPTQLEREEFNGIAVAGEMPDDFLRLMVKPGRPMVLMDFESPAELASALLTDNYYWGCRVTQHLINRGHRDIGFVGQPGSTNSISDRFFGYQRTLLHNGLTYHPEWQLVNNDVRTGLYISNIDLPEALPTAFVCHCDMAATYLLASLSERGLRCPDDVSVISFDNTSLAQTSLPPLTSVNIDIRAFAREAIELLCAADRSISRIYMPASLIERDSVRALEKGAVS